MNSIDYEPLSREETNRIDRIPVGVIKDEDGNVCHRYPAGLDGDVRIYFMYPEGIVLKQIRNSFGSRILRLFRRVERGG